MLDHQLGGDSPVGETVGMQLRISNAAKSKHNYPSLFAPSQNSLGAIKLLLLLERNSGLAILPLEDCQRSRLSPNRVRILVCRGAEAPLEDCCLLLVLDDLKQLKRFLLLFSRKHSCWHKVRIERKF